MTPVAFFIHAITTIRKNGGFFMYTKLMAFMNKPELNDPCTSSLYCALWNDEHISKGMLLSHLNPDEEGATCKHEFVFKSVKWIAEIAPPSQFGKLLDLGCGPGVYAELFAKEGYSVTGVDYSKRSIGYANEQTKLNNSGIEYLYQNYLTIDYTEQFDVITIINKDYAVFSITDRMMLLKKVYQALKPGGKFILDVMTPKRRQKEHRSWHYSESGGFFSEKPHILLEVVYQYDDDDKTELGKSIVITDEDVKCFICPNHYFTKELLVSEIQHAGFNMFEFYGDVAGNSYADTGEIICGVFTK